MNPRRPEMADIVRTHHNEFLARWNPVLSREQRKALRDIRDCRTAALGGRVQQCDRCGHRVILYNSCRNRHCPKCQATARARWLAQRETELLPVPYFHVVFTLPSQIGRLALQNPKLIYSILFRTAAATLLETASDPRLLGAHIGFLAVLHTWGQNLHLHPHLHCVVPGGGIALDGSRWIGCRKSSFFLPVRVLSHRFRKSFLRALRHAFRKGILRFHGELKALSDPGAFLALCDQAAAIDWVVHVKPPFGGPRRVLKYLARYTHRVAISNHRLRALQSGRVSFEWKDYAHRARRKLMTIDAIEFLRRFLLHVLPSGLVRIRQFGFLANRVRKSKLELCRTLLAAPLPAAPSNGDNGEVNENPQPCPICKLGRLLLVEFIAVALITAPDTS
jgi:Putative transposase/Transposase zinc-binding domain